MKCCLEKIYFYFWGELEDVLFYVEVILKNYLLSYVEEDIQLFIFILNLLQFDCLNLLFEIYSYNLESFDLIFISMFVIL